MNVAFLVAPEGVEQIELTDPWQAVRDAGHAPTGVHRVRPRPGVPPPRQGGHLRGRPAVQRGAGRGVRRPRPARRRRQPRLLRMDKRAVAFVRGFFDAGKPVAAICHAPWTLVEADVVRGRNLTSWPSLRTDITQRGRHLGRRAGQDLRRAARTP